MNGGLSTHTHTPTPPQIYTTSSSVSALTPTGRSSSDRDSGMRGSSDRDSVGANIAALDNMCDSITSQEGKLIASKVVVKKDAFLKQLGSFVIVHFSRK